MADFSEVKIERHKHPDLKVTEKDIAESGRFPVQTSSGREFKFNAVIAGGRGPNVWDREIQVQVWHVIPGPSPIMLAIQKIEAQLDDGAIVSIEQVDCLALTETVIVEAKYAKTEIRLLQLDEGWIYGIDVHYDTGDHSGASWAPSIHDHIFPSRSAAVISAINYALGHFDVEKLKGGCCTDAQRVAAREMTAKLQSLLEQQDQLSLFGGAA